jgi:hypothetical protein
MLIKWTYASYNTCMAKEQTPAQRLKLRTKREPGYKIIREALRNYTTYQRHVALYGQDVIEHSYVVYNDDASPKEKVTVTLSYSDLLRGAKELSPKKRQALWLSIILDKTQEDVAAIMNTQPATIAQYCRISLNFLSDNYFCETSHVGEEIDHVEA